MCMLHISSEARQRERALSETSVLLFRHKAPVWGQKVPLPLSAAYDYPKVLYCL